MSRAERNRLMGEAAWDEPLTPEELREARRREPGYNPPPIPGVLFVKPAPLPTVSPKGTP